jgi:hypothetical protein
MLINLALGLSTIVLCLFLQSVLLLVALRYYSRHKSLINSPSFWTTMVVIKSVMLLLVFGNLMQVAIWALVFMFVGEFAQFNEAFYHSAVNFATLGYGDLVMSAEHKLLGPIEAINGGLMIGISTAALMTTFQDAVRKTLAARKYKSSLN